MMRKRIFRSSSIVKQLVIGFGFLNGIWFAIGISPEDVVMKVLGFFVDSFPQWLKALFIIAPAVLLLLTIFTMIKIYRKGGLMGAGAVLLAFIAGSLILKMPIVSIGLLIVALILGSQSFKR